MIFPLKVLNFCDNKNLYWNTDNKIKWNSLHIHVILHTLKKRQRGGNKYTCLVIERNPVSDAQSRTLASLKTYVLKTDQWNLQNLRMFNKI